LATCTLNFAKPGNSFIEVLEDAEIVNAFEKKTKNFYTLKFPTGTLFRILTENSFANQERLMDNLSLSAEERFENLEQNILRSKIPQNRLFYGVTPEFFSKMKSKLLRSSNQFKLLIRIVLTFKNTKSTTSSIV
jgi:hypothetical protein